MSDSIYLPRSALYNYLDSETVLAEPEPELALVLVAIE